MLIVLLEFRAARVCQDAAVVEVLSCMELMRRHYSSFMGFHKRKAPAVHELQELFTSPPPEAELRGKENDVRCYFAGAYQLASAGTT